MKKSTLFSFSLLLLVMLLPGQAAQAEIAIVANAESQLHGVSLATIAKVYRGEIKHLDKGVNISAVDQPKGSEIRKQFYKKVLNMTEKEVSRYWSKYRFTGKRKPPQIKSSDAEVKRWIATHPDAIGYIKGDSVDSSVKLLQIIP